jgi:hypothetical protein
MAMLETTIVLARLLKVCVCLACAHRRGLGQVTHTSRLCRAQRFSFKVQNAEKATYGITVTLPMAHGLFVQATPRVTA